MASEEHWAQLVSTTDLDSEPVLIKENKFTIGRAAGCDLCLGSNKLVSSKHCYIEASDDKYLIVDTSTNGTLLNLKTRVTKGKRHELKHGDEIHVVYKKDQEDLNIGYLFQVKAELENEHLTESFTQEYECDQTLLDDHESAKRKREEDVSETPSKKPKADDEPDSQATEVDSEHAASSKEASSKPGTSAMAEDDDDMLQSLTCIICQEILYDCISLQPCMHSFCSGCYSDWMKTSNECPTCRVKVDRINKNHIVNNCVESYLKSHPDKKRSEEDMKDLDSRNRITRDMLYSKKTLVRHSSEGSSSSEDERFSVTPRFHYRPRYNPGIVNFNPALVSLGHGLTTPYATIRPPRTLCRQCPPDPTGSGAQQVPVSADSTTSSSSENNVPSSTPVNIASTETSESQGNSAEPSTSTGTTSRVHPDDQKIMPTIPNYVCNLNQNHILCTCCLLPMPDRRHEQSIPAQNCAICFRAFCHAYWGCQKSDCLGCIAKFSVITLGRKCLTNIILDNLHESNVFKDYLVEKNISVRQLQRECVDKLHAGAYTCPDGARIRGNPDIYMCYSCGLRNYKELAYQYRRDIARSELPDAVTSRPDCYWGRNCRTQKNRPPHAQKFSHICEQTRTS
ncbi:E3 ubiquitin-protein ligase CHFR-like isoform X2 [Tubulanus polymorphus]|uniref:E3 ubiquitin-protein ligase CHFR-like isoform X2 n=1 Tax=Tubulanus polymorphus TaxID=672921 RepID=UPI003DA600AD